MRRPAQPRADARLIDGPRAVVEREASRVLADLWELLDVPVVPATPAVLERAGYKMRQLAIAGSLGFAIPETLVTNDADAFLDHYAESSGRMITKRAVSSQRVQTLHGGETGRHTTAVRHRDLVEVGSVRLGPIMAQPAVDKQIELRVTVVGDEVFSAAIHSQETHHTKLDFRRYDDSHTRITPYPLPPAERDLCLAITHALGLCYSTIDLILTPEGRTVFLEVNPNGQYLWIADSTGLPISRALAMLLAKTSLS
jgi:glutathione synthase/RimK-type ligase-like ATP-grasp enzyme